MDLKRASKDDLITEINRFAAVVEQLQTENKAWMSNMNVMWSNCVELQEEIKRLKKENATLHHLNTSYKARLDRIANLQGDEINRAWEIANGED